MTLHIYRYIKLFQKYFISLYLNAIITKIKLDNIFRIKIMYLLNGNNIINVVNAPNKEESNILFIVTFLFKVMQTVSSKIKSYIKFNINNKSIYIVILSPNLLYKKNTTYFVVF